MEITVKATNYHPKSITFEEGFLGPKGNVGYSMVADWNKAKSIIEKLISEGRNIIGVYMGLDGDWNENSMIVYENGCFYEYDLWQDSIWAEPILIVYYEDGTTEAYSVWNKL